MEENKIQSEKIVNENASKADHYTKTSQKFVDFFFGFLGFFILPFAYSLISLISFIPFWVYFFISAAILVTLCILFFMVGRRFIAIGIISMGLISILIFGSCLLLLSGL